MRRLLVLCFLLASCYAPNDSREALQKSGYRNIQIDGWAPFNCGDNDTFSTGFTATNSNGERVSGTVCCGLIFKGCTVRF